MIAGSQIVVPALALRASDGSRLDADSKFPWDNIRKMADLGLLGVPWSEDMHGAGLDLISFMIVIHEMAKVDA